jgi:hypothetical protein
MQPRAGQFAGQQRQARLALDFTSGGDDAFGGASDGDLGIEIEPEVFDPVGGIVAVRGVKKMKRRSGSMPLERMVSRVCATASGVDSASLMALAKRIVAGADFMGVLSLRSRRSGKARTRSACGRRARL